jgi:hypothetical protein
MSPLVISTLNDCYDPRIDSNAPEHFSARWPHIQSAVVNADVVVLQEDTR